MDTQQIDLKPGCCALKLRLQVSVKSSLDSVAPFGLFAALILTSAGFRLRLLASTLFSVTSFTQACDVERCFMTSKMLIAEMKNNIAIVAKITFHI